MVQKDKPNGEKPERYLFIYRNYLVSSPRAFSSVKEKKKSEIGSLHCQISENALQMDYRHD